MSTTMSGWIGTVLESDLAKDWRQWHMAQWNNPSWWNLLTLWPLPFVLVFCVYQSHLDRQIGLRQQETSAVVVSHDPSNHDRYGYEFAVNGRLFAGWVYPHSRTDYTIGQTVTVYYDPVDPAKNSGTGFALVSADDLFFVPFCLAGLIGLPVFIYVRRCSWRRKVAHHPAANHDL